MTVTPVSGSPADTKPKNRNHHKTRQRRGTDPMKEWLSRSVEAENLNTSAPIRKVMESYLTQKHGNLRPAAETA
jgi:hypothetical protein